MNVEMCRETIAMVGCPPCGSGHDAVVQFESGEQCRSYAAKAPAGVGVVVGRDIVDVASENLVAALKKDCPTREVLVLDDSGDDAFGLRARQAGANGVLTSQVLQRVLDMQTPASSPRVPARSNARSSCEGESARIALVSGRGGVGRSSLSVMLGLAASRLGLSVALLDMDVQFGDVAFLCGKDARFSFVKAGDAVAGEVAGKRAEHQGSQPVTVIYADGQGEPSARDGQVQNLQAAFEAVSMQCDVAIVNTGPSWSHAVASTVLSCDIVVFVMDQRLTSVQGCRRARDLCVAQGMPTARFAYILNRSSTKGQVSVFDCAMALGTDEVIEVQDGGPEVDELLSLGLPSELFDSGNAMAVSSLQATRRLAGRLGLQVASDKAGTQKRVRKAIRRNRAGKGATDVVAR